ncbi:family 43 glycosylhydrolase [Streptomyces sp. NPDC005549]|uniref:family 43 glycosylhydrolase n=1 Tax=Streptomyces sp. NPDC005549 TaxID=3154888 RepID=UPI0033A48A73
MTVLRNPVIRGFAPDPSLVRAGDRYYVATSSFEWFPTIPIHRSRDLAHWEYAGHVEGAAPGGSLAGVPDSGGVWAPSLSWDGERFWVVYAVVRSVGTPYFDLDTYVCTAPRVSGPWTAPRRVPGHGFDPALFHEDGRLWLLNLQNDHRPGGRRFAGIVMTELDRRTLAPVGGTHLLLQHDRLVEGPKLLRRGDRYYLVLAEGGTGFEHGVRVARADALTGPYELADRPLLTSRDDPSLALQKAGHGELVQTPDGQWVLGHLAARPLATPHGPRCTLGRETAVQRVTWDEAGWPRLRQGGTHPAVEVEAPPPTAPEPPTPPADAPRGVEAPARLAPGPPTTPADIPPGAEDPIPTGPRPPTPPTDTPPGVEAPTSTGPRPPTPPADAPPRVEAPTRADPGPPDGPADVSAWPWSTLREPPDPSWADAVSRPGRIRLRGRHGPESRWAYSLLAQRLTEHRAEAQVTVLARPRSFTQAAGLVLRYDAEAYLALDLTWAEDSGEEQRGQQWRGGGRTVLSLVDRAGDGARRVAVADAAPDVPLTLGVTVDHADARFWYVRDGARTPIGPVLDFSRLSDDHGDRLRFTGAMAGIHAVDLVDGTFTAEFTGFRLTCTPS